MKEEATFADAEAYQGSNKSDSALTFPLLVLLHVQRVASLGAADFAAGGYWSERESLSRHGAPSVSIYSYHESAGRSFENAVLTLYDLVSGHAGDHLAGAFADYERSVEVIDREINEEIATARAQGEITKVRWMQIESQYCDRRGSSVRPLFRAVLTWLKGSNYLTSDSFEEGLTE